MNEEKFNNLSKEEQIRLSSDYRKTVHDGEIVFVEDDNAKSLSAQEAKELLIKQRNELLASLGFETPSDKEKDSDSPRHTR